MEICRVCLNETLPESESIETVTSDNKTIAEVIEFISGIQVKLNKSTFSIPFSDLLLFCRLTLKRICLRKFASYAYLDYYQHQV
jgi:hypothetical protein